MLNFINSLMAPLDSEYCHYFYFLGLFALVLAMFHLLNLGYNMISKNKKPNYHCILHVLHLAIVYFVNRLLYNMCIN